MNGRSGPFLLVAALTLTLTLVGSVAPGKPTPDANLGEQQRRLAVAQREAAEAQVRADRLVRRAADERDAAARAAADEGAMVARVAAAAADLEMARARMAIVGDLLAAQRAQLGEAQAPVARLLAALQSLARRPAIVAVAQPGSIDDLVHVRAVLGTAIPAIRARTAGVRGELNRTRTLAGNAALAAVALRAGRVRLEGERTRLAMLEADHRRRAAGLGRNALDESDRALALGERARDLVDRMGEDSAAAVTTASLADLPGPTMRPLAPGATLPAAPRGVYRLPVRGRLVTGFDEISPNGVRSRGMTFAVTAGSPVVAPAAGVVRYARRFRDYGSIVVIDHGAGWSSLVTGLGDVAVEPGSRVAMGTALGTADGREEPRVTLELRRRGRPIDAAALIG